MQCVYGAGVLTALREEYSLTEPDLIIAASGSVGGALYYQSAQYESGLAMWLSVAKRPEFLSYLRRPIIDIDWLIEMLKKEHPIDFATLAASKTKLIVPLTRAGDGVTVYYPMPRDASVYEVIRAAKAIPFAYGKTVTLGGVEYVDGDFGSGLDDYIREAVSDGATTIIAINNQNGTSAWFRGAMRALSSLGSLQDGIGLARAAKRELAQPPAYIPPEGVRVIMLRRPESPRLSLTHRSPSAMRAAFNRGYDDAVQNPFLKDALKIYAIH